MQKVNKHQAIALKSLSCDLASNNYYTDNTSHMWSMGANVISTNQKIRNDEYISPYIDEVIEWLDFKHKIVALPNYNFIFDTWGYTIYDRETKQQYVSPPDAYPSIDMAKSALIDKSIEVITQKYLLMRESLID